SPLPSLKPFALTLIHYDPLHPLSIPLTLLSLTPIFLFVSYLTLIIFTRRLTTALLVLGQLSNEALSLILKRLWKGHRPYRGFGEVGDGWGMPSSHSQAAGFLVAWGIGYALTDSRRYMLRENEAQAEVVRRIRAWRKRIYIFGLVLWSVLVAYSRYHLYYHSPIQIIYGYGVGLIAGSIHFGLTEYIPMFHPNSFLARVRDAFETVWQGIGGIGGWDIGGTPGGWGEG
ncbi:hypothetical protein BCR39DRAFT_448415, partial [Naematelia encephala]